SLYGFRARNSKQGQANACTYRAFRYPLVKQPEVPKFHGILQEEAPMRRFTLLAGCLVTLLTISMLGLTGCGGGGKSSDLKRIVILTNGNSPFWDAARAGLTDAKKQLELEKAGYDAIVDPNDSTDQGQINKLRQFGSQSDIVAVGVSV